MIFCFLLFPFDFLSTPPKIILNALGFIFYLHTQMHKAKMLKGSSTSQQRIKVSYLMPCALRLIPYLAPHNFHT